MNDTERARELSRDIARDIIDLAREIDKTTTISIDESLAIATKAYEIAVAKIQGEALLRAHAQQTEVLERIALRLQWMN